MSICVPYYQAFGFCHPNKIIKLISELHFFKSVIYDPSLVIMTFPNLAYLPSYTRKIYYKFLHV